MKLISQWIYLANDLQNIANYSRNIVVVHTTFNRRGHTMVCHCDIINANFMSERSLLLFWSKQWKKRLRKKQIGLVFIFLLLRFLPFTRPSLFAFRSHTPFSSSSEPFLEHMKYVLIHLFSVYCYFSVVLHGYVGWLSFFGTIYLCIQNTANYNMWGQNVERIFIKCLSNQPTENGSSGGCLIGWCLVYFSLSHSLALCIYSLPALKILEVDCYRASLTI